MENDASPALNQPVERDAQEHVKLGKMKTGFFTFFTPSILLFFAMILGVIIYGRGSIWHFFVSGDVPINALIISGIIFSFVRMYLNINLMRQTAFYLQRIENLSDKGATPEDANQLKRDLERQGRLIDLKNMAIALDNMGLRGFFTLTDNDARLIKSKVGFRASSNRQSVGFLSGILIMLGLLGTYIGLLHTLDAVGAAMAGMANIGGDSAGAAPSGEGGLSGDEMSGFIASIAKPLQGMGLAFSASLFGIGGSLIVSFFNYLAGHSQDHFMENISRWVDERIPTPDTKMVKLAENKSVPGSDDLKAWLASFVYLSQKTNKKLGQLILVMTKTVSIVTQQGQATEHLGQRQAEIAASLDRLNLRAEEIKGQSGNFVQRSETYMQSFDKSLQDIRQQAQHMNGTHGGMNNHITALQAKVEGMNENLRMSLGTLSHDIKNALNTISAVQDSGTQAIASALRDVQNAVSDSSAKEQELLQTLSTQPRSITQEKDVELSNLVYQLNSLLEELNSKHGDNFLDIFEESNNNKKL